MLAESLRVAYESRALRTRDLARVTVDTTVQPKNITFPTDAKLLHAAIKGLIRLVRRHGVRLRQSYLRVAKQAAMMAGRHAHAKGGRLIARDGVQPSQRQHRRIARQGEGSADETQVDGSARAVTDGSESAQKSASGPGAPPATPSGPAPRPDLPARRQCGGRGRGVDSGMNLVHFSF